MAVKAVWTDLDGQKVGILKDWRFNPLTTSQRTTLGSLLNAAHEGLFVFDTDTNYIYFWDGTAWISGTAPVAGAMTYKGAYSNLTTAPVGAADGDTYVMTAAGTLTWAGITFNPSADVQVGDMVVRRSATVWDVVQGNAVDSSETVAGIIEIATQAETNAGTDDVRAVTPLKLATYISNQGLAKTYFASGLTLVANTPLTISHNLNLQNKDAFVISVKDSAGSEVGVDVDSVNVNSLTIESSVAATNVVVTVIGR